MPTPRKSTPKKSTPRKTAAEKRAAQAAAEQQQNKLAHRTLAQKRQAAMGSDALSADEYAPTVWGTETASGALHDLYVPSGQKVLVQRVGPEVVLGEGMLDDLDMLATMIPQISGKGRSAKDVDPTHLLKNPKMVRDAMKLFDRVLCLVVVKPEITPEPDDPADKIKGKVYTSSISLDDKSFIFNWAMGDQRTKGRFPEESEGHMADLATGEES